MTAESRVPSPHLVIGVARTCVECASRAGHVLRQRSTTSSGAHTSQHSSLIAAVTWYTSIDPRRHSSVESLSSPHGFTDSSPPSAEPCLPRPPPPPRPRLRTSRCSSGSRMPLIGLGLWKAEQGSAADVVHTAIRLGYRHFDSAADYGNERQTGEGLQRALSAGLVKPRGAVHHVQAVVHGPRQGARAPGGRAHPGRPSACRTSTCSSCTSPSPSSTSPPPRATPAGWAASGNAADAVLSPDPLRGTWEGMEELVAGRPRPQHWRVQHERRRLLQDLLRYAKHQARLQPTRAAPAAAGHPPRAASASTAQRRRGGLLALRRVSSYHDLFKDSKRGARRCWSTQRAQWHSQEVQEDDGAGAAEVERAEGGGGHTQEHQ